MSNVIKQLKDPFTGQNYLANNVGCTCLNRSTIRLTARRQRIARRPCGKSIFSGDRSESQKLQDYLIPAAFAQNAIGTYGVLGRNVFRAWCTSNIDAGLFKSFTIYERLNATYSAVGVPVEMVGLRRT